MGCAGRDLAGMANLLAGQMRSRECANSYLIVIPSQHQFGPHGMAMYACINIPSPFSIRVHTSTLHICKDAELSNLPPPIDRSCSYKTTSDFYVCL